MTKTKCSKILTYTFTKRSRTITSDMKDSYAKEGWRAILESHKMSVINLLFIFYSLTTRW